MSFIEWSLAQQPQTPVQVQQALALQRENLQQQRGLSALHGIDVSDPNSVQSGINALTGLGLGDQAKALTDLAFQRANNQANQPNISALAGLFHTRIQALADQQQNQSHGAPAPSPQQPSQPTPDQLQQAQQTLSAAGDAITRVKALPPEQRGAALDQELQQFQVAGLDPQAIAAVKQHLTDANFSDESLDDLTNHYAEHAENFGTMAAGGPPGENLSTHPTNRYGPGTDQAAETLNNPLYTDPLSQGYAAGQLHTDLAPAVNQAIAITGNQRAAPFQMVAPVDTLGRPQQMSAARFAEGQTQPNAGAIAGPSTYETAQRTAAANAPYGMVTTNTGPGGAQQTQSEAQFGAGRGAPQIGPEGQIGAAPTNAPPLTAPSPAAAAVNVAGGNQLAGDFATAGQSQQQVNALQQIVRLLPTTNVGPGVEATNNIRSFLQTQLPILNRLIPGMDQRALETANTNELQKYMAQLASAASGQYGPASDAKLASAITGNPHMTMDGLSALDVSRTMLALKRADMAKPYLFTTIRGADGQPPDQGQYGAFSSNYARTVDPRAFELDMLSPPERQKMMATITSPEDKQKFLLGVQAAEAAGYYHRADLPR